jgi:hypothetical protein
MRAGLLGRRGGVVGVIERLWTAGEMPFRDGLYRPDDTGLEVHVNGPGAYHPDAGQPIPFRLGRVSSRDQWVVRARSLIQIIEARRWRPAR